MGPITEWWLTGLDGLDENEKVILGLSSARADYYLSQPTSEYLPLLKPLTEKAEVTKMVFQFLLSCDEDEEKSYENLLDYLEVTDCSGRTRGISFVQSTFKIE